MPPAPQILAAPQGRLTQLGSCCSVIGGLREKKPGKLRQEFLKGSIQAYGIAGRAMQSLA